MYIVNRTICDTKKIKKKPLNFVASLNLLFKIEEP